MTWYKNNLEKRNKYRKINYERGRFGNRNHFTKFERWLIRCHLISDRHLAKLLHTTTNGIQACRWRMRKNYRGLYDN